MIEALYWWDEALKLKEQARKTEKLEEQQQLVELAAVCEQVATEAEDRSTGG